MEEFIIGVDLGGTNIRAALLDSNLNIVHRRQVLTQAYEGFSPTLARIKALVKDVIPADGRRVTGIGISVPGPVNPAAGLLVSPPNLPGWHNVPLEREIRETFGLPTFLGNDANVAALAEAAKGAARGKKNIIFITISTGIGGGIISDGRLLLGRDGLAAEVGHIVIMTNGVVSTLEKEAAGPALVRKALARMEQGEASIIRDLVAGDLSRVGGSVVGTAAQQGDALALDIVSQAGRVVGLGIVSLLHLFNPEIVVLGGGVSRLGELLFKSMRDMIQLHSIDRAYWEHLEIVPAQLQDDVSIIGAAALVIVQGGLIDVEKSIARIEGES